MYIWKRGDKIIDKWDLSKIDPNDETYSRAITPVLVKDNHGNMWVMNHNRCDLVLKKSMVK